MAPIRSMVGKVSFLSVASLGSDPISSLAHTGRRLRISAARRRLRALILPLLMICFISIDAFAQKSRAPKLELSKDAYGRVLYKMNDAAKEEFAPDEILVKLKSTIPAELLGNGQTTLLLNRPIDLLFAKYSIRQAEPLFRQLQGRQSLFGSDQKALAAFQKTGLESIYKFKLHSQANLKAAISDFRKNPDVEYAI
jgi:hypothetical protein